VVQPGEHEQLENLLRRVLSGELRPECVGHGARVVELVREADHQPFFRCPAGIGGLAADRRALLLFGPLCLRAEHRHVHAPLVFRSAARAGAKDHELAGAQRDAAAVEQVARHHALQDARVARHRTEQRQRRRPAHQLVEIRLDLGRVRRLKWGDAGC